jgi:hypothetical protein
MERRRALLQLQQDGLGRKDRSRGSGRGSVPRGAAVVLAAAASLLLVLLATGYGPSGWASREEAAVSLPSITPNKPIHTPPIQKSQSTALKPDAVAQPGAV